MHHAGIGWYALVSFNHFCLLNKRRVEMPLFGPPNIEKLRKRRNIKALIKVLEYDGLSLFSFSEPHGLRDAAAKALVEIGSEAVEPLCKVLEDSWGDAKERAAWALGQIGDERAVRPLIAALEEDSKDPLGRPETKVRCVAALALGQIGDVRAVRPLLAILDKRWEISDVQSAAAEALDKFGLAALETVLNSHSDRMPAALLSFVERLGVDAVERLLAALKDTSPHVREQAIRLLYKIGVRDARVIEPLLDELQDQESGVRDVAALTLGQIGDARAVETLVVALQDKFEHVRRAAAEALGQIGDVRAVEYIVSARKKTTA
jgi:HEAT repeat protein